MNLIPPQEAEKAAREYQNLGASAKHAYNRATEAANAKFQADVVPVLENSKSLLEMFYFRSFKEIQPKQRSFVIGASNVGYNVYEFKHGCFFIGLERHDDVHHWMILPDAITSQLVESALTNLNKLIK